MRAAKAAMEEQEHARDLEERQRKASFDAAWATLDTAQLPASLEEVAQNAKGVDSIAPLALIQAGDQYLRSVQTGTRFDREATAEDFALDDDSRTLFLQRADALYSEAILAVGTDYERVFAKKLLVISALFGQAAVAESRGDAEAAKTVLSQIETIAVPEYPDLAAQAKARSESQSIVTTKVSFPLAADLPQPAPAEALPDPSELLGTSIIAPATEEAADTDSDSATNLILEGGAGTTEAPGDGSE